MARLGAFDVSYDPVALFDAGYDPSGLGWFDADLLGLRFGYVVAPPLGSPGISAVDLPQSPVLLLGATPLVAAGSLTAARPIQADYLPTPSVAFLFGANLAAARSILVPPVVHTGGDISPTPIPTLTRVATAVTLIPFVAPAQHADDPVSQYPRLLQGAILAAAGKVVAPAPAADFLPAPLPMWTRAPTIVLPSVLVAASPSADAMVPQYSRLLLGYTLTAAGSIVTSRPVRADDVSPQFPDLLTGAAPPSAGQIVTSRPVRADDIPPQAPLLRSGALLAASGRVLAPTPSADSIPPQQGAVLVGYTLTAAGAVIASRPVRADDITPQFSELLSGAKFVAAGSIVAPRPVRADDAIPPQFSSLLHGYNAPTSGRIVAPSPTADFLPTPQPIFKLAPSIIYPTILVHPAPAADPIPLVFPQVLAGYKLVAGSIIKANPVRADDSMIPVFPHLLAGYTLTAAGNIVKANPVRADDIALATTTLVKGFVKVTGIILAAPPVADFLPTPTPELLTGYTLPPSGSIIAPYPIHADDISPQFSSLLRGYLLLSGSIVTSRPVRADDIPIVQPQLLSGYTPLAAAGSIVASRPVRADDISPQRSALLQGFLSPKISFIAFRPIRAEDVVPQQGAFLHGTTITAAGTIVAPRPLRADDIPPVQLKIFSGFTLTSAGSIIASRPVRADDITPQFSALLHGYTLSSSGRIVAAYPVRADDITPQKTSFITPVVYPPAFLISPRPVRADDITPQFSTILRGTLIGKAGFVVAPAPAAPFFPAPPATILIGSLPLPPAGSIVAFRPIRADDVPPQFPKMLQGYIFIPPPVGTSTSVVCIEFEKNTWVLGIRPNVAKIEFESNIFEVVFESNLKSVRLGETNASEVSILPGMATYVERAIFRGDTLFFLDSVWTDLQTQQIFTVPVTDPLTPPPPNSQPYNLTGVHITFTLKNYVPDPDAESLMQLDNLMLGGVVVTSSINGQFSVTGPAQATVGFDDSRIPVEYDIQIKTAAGNIFTVERGKLEVKPDITRFPG